MHLVLIGFKSSGKTYLGQLLAKKLRLPFIDTDQLIIQRFQKEYLETLSCKQIVQKKGEFFFRELEKEILLSFSYKSPCIVATGGGIIKSPENRKAIQSLGKVIYLQVQQDILFYRFLQYEQQPYFLKKRGDYTSFKIEYNKRAPLYEKTAHILLDISKLSPEQTVNHLAIFSNELKNL